MAGGLINWTGGPPPQGPDITPEAAGIFNYFQQSGAQGVADVAQTGAALAQTAGNPSLPSYQQTAPTVGMGPDGSFYVQGQNIKPGDYANQVAAVGSLNAPRQGQLPAGYTEMTPEAYRAWVAQVQHPTSWLNITSNFGRGVDIAKQNLGRAVQTAGVGLDMPGVAQWGKGIGDYNAEQLRMSSPYDASNRSGFDWLAGNVASAAPMLAGAIGAGIAGSAAGTAIAPGAGTLAGGVGGVLGAFGYNYPFAVGDEAQHQLDTTGRIDPGAAAAWAVPYTVAQSAGEAVPVATFLGKLGAAGGDILGNGFGAGVREIGRRALIGGAEGAVGGGVGGVGQQASLRGGAGQALWSPEAQNEYLQSAGAGAAVGGALGGAAGIFARPHARAPAETGEPLPPNGPADLLNQPSQRMLPPPGEPNLPGGGGVRPDFYGTNRTGTAVGPHWGEHIQDAEWTEVPPEQLPGLPGPGSPALLGAPEGQRLLAGPTDPDLFGHSRWTEPGPPTEPPAGGGGTGLSPEEFYNQTPMGQHIADQLVAEHTPPAPPERPTSARGGTMADMLSTLTGRATPEQKQAAALRARGDIAHEAIASAGEQAFEEMHYPGTEVNPQGNQPVADFRAPGAVVLRRGAAAPAEAAPAAPSHTDLKTRFAAASENMPEATRKQVAKSLNAPKLGEAKRTELAARIAEHAPAPPAAAQSVEEPAPAPTPAPAARGRMLAPSEFITEEPAAPATPAAKLKELGNKVGPQSKAKLGDRLYALANAMSKGDWNELHRALRTAGDQEALSKVASKLDDIESKYRSMTKLPVKAKAAEKSMPPGEAKLRGSRPPATDLVELPPAEPSKVMGMRTREPERAPDIEAHLTKQIDSLPDSAPESTVMLAHEYMDQGNYGHAQMVIDAARNGVDVSKYAMTMEERAAQEAKINARPEQKSADADIEAGVDPERAQLLSTINRLAEPGNKKAAKLSERQHAELMALSRGDATNEQLRARAKEAAGEKAFNAAENWRENKQAEAEGRGTTKPLEPDKVQEAIDALKEQYGTPKIDADRAKADAKVEAATRQPPKTQRMPIFKREDAVAFTGKGIPKEHVQAVVDKAIKSWKRPPKINVHGSHDDLPAYYRERVSKGAKGFFDRTTGEVHLIASNLADLADAHGTLLHEALGHFGLWNHFTTRLSGMLVDMYRGNKTVQRAADRYLDHFGLDHSPQNIAHATEETLAEWFAPGVLKVKAWTQIKGYIRGIGRAIGLVHGYTNDDVISVMHKAQQYTMRSDGPVTYMDHADAYDPETMEREGDFADKMEKAPSWLRDNATLMGGTVWDAIKNKAPKIMLTNQLLDDWLPSMGATAAQRVAQLVRGRDTMTNGLMRGAREWAARMENEPIEFRRRNKGIGAPDLDNFSGFVETARRRGRWGFVPDDGRFPADDMGAVDERFNRGQFNAKGEQVGPPLLDPELKAAFDKFTPSQQQLVRDYYTELFNSRDKERETLVGGLRDNYAASSVRGKERINALEHELAIEQEKGTDKAKIAKLEKAHADAIDSHADLQDGFGKAMRGVESTYRDMEYVPYSPMQRHGKYVVMGESKALRAAREGRRAANRRGEEYKAPEGEKSIYAMEADPAHYFVSAVDSIADAKRMVRELDKDADFSGGRNVWHDTTKPGEQLFAGSDVIAGLQKIIGNVSSSGESSAINNTLLATAQRTIIEAMSANNAKKADLLFRNIRSAPMDMPRAFMSRMLSSSQFLSSQKYATDINRALHEAQDQIKYDVKPQDHARATAALNEFIGRYNDDLQPKSQDVMADKLSGIASIWMLTASPSYYVQQIAQNMVITAPYLSGRFGVGETTRAFKTAYAQAHKAFAETGGGSALKGASNYLANGMLDISKVDPKYRELLRFGQDMGLLDVGMNLETGKVSSDTSTKPWSKAEQGLNNSVRGLEAVNRITSLIAASDLMQSGGKITPETISNILGVDAHAFAQRYQDYLASHQTSAEIADMEHGSIAPPMTKEQFAAAEFARQVVLDTHGDYSSSNKPVWTRTGLGRIATQFRTFNAMMAGTYAKTFHRAFFNGELSAAEKAVARRTLMYMTGSAALFAGASGLPGAATFGLVYALAAGMGMQPSGDYQKDLREAVGDPHLSNILLYGAPSLLGLDVSGSMGLGNMFSVAPSADTPTDAKSYATWMLAMFGGPSAGGLGTKAFDAYDLWANKGQTYQAMQALLPRFLSGPAKAYHDANYGLYNRSGAQIMKPEDISTAEKVWGALGFQSSEASARGWSRSRAFAETEYFSNTGASIKRDYTEAKAAGDMKAMQEARDNWQALQASRQRFGFTQQPIGQLTSAPQQVAKTEKDVFGSIAYTKGSKGEALKLGQLAGAGP